MFPASFCLHYHCFDGTIIPYFEPEWKWELFRGSLVQLPVKGITHNDFRSLTAKADTVKYMLTKERCAYPKKLFYKTWIARHRTAYWITLDNIQRGAKVAEIQAEVEGNTIQIHTVGTDGLKIQIPPYLREYKDICVSINEHKRILAVKDLPPVIHVSISDAGWEMTTESVPFSAKGTGLLDVYCNPVRVLYNSGNLQSIADVFAHPMCTGFNANDQRVLLISSNNWVVFKKFLFFRHLILPTYLNGPQSFLNNEVLLLTRHGIYAAYENGGVMTKV